VISEAVFGAAGADGSVTGDSAAASAAKGRNNLSPSAAAPPIPTVARKFLLDILILFGSLSFDIFL
jgi:hypothetical protein